jgi:hypothetical protein
LPAALDIARFLAPAVAGYAGLAALSAVFRDRLQQMFVPFKRNHVVVCGLGDVGYVLVRHLHEIGERVVAVEACATNPHIAMCRLLHVPVIIGDAQSRRTLSAAGVERATRLVAVCLDDVVNTETVSAALELAHRRRGELSCLARIADPELCALLRVQAAKRDDMVSQEDFFNVDEIGARLLLMRFDEFFGSAGANRAQPHILVAQLDVLGEWVVWHAAWDWYHNRADSHAPLVVTVVDEDAEKRVHALKGRHPELKDEQTCLFVYCSESVDDIRALGDQHARERLPRIQRAYVTAYQDKKCLQTALKLRHVLPPDVPLVAAVWRARGAAALSRRAGGLMKQVEVFSTLESSCTVDLVRGGSFEMIAQAIHRHYLKIQDIPSPAWTEWADLEESFRESNRAQARHIAVKLRAVGYEIALLRDWGAASFDFNEEQITTLADMEHDRWARDKEAQGWKWGPQRDNVNKLHPLLVPYDELPVSQQEVDRGFVRVIPSLLASVGLQMVPAHDFGPAPTRAGKSTLTEGAVGRTVGT